MPAKLFLAIGALAMLAAVALGAFGVVTPVGGVAFMLAWVMFAVAVVKEP